MPLQHPFTHDSTQAQMLDTLLVNILVSSTIEDEELSAQSGLSSLDWKCQQPHKGNFEALFECYHTTGDLTTNLFIR